MRAKPERIASGFYFLEGPRWRDGWLWVSDMIGRTVHKVSLEGQVERVVDVPGRPSGLGFLNDGSLLLVSMRDRRLYKHRNDTLVLHADLATLVADDLNDMIVDINDRAYIGSYGFPKSDLPQVRGGHLLLVEPSGKARIAHSGLMFPNGCVIDQNRRELILAETFAQRLTAFEIAENGELINPRIYAELGGVSPDGICLDAEGCVWVAAAKQPYFLRARDGGQISHRIRMKARQAVACQLGGPDGRTLFCLTADKDFEDVDGCEATAAIDVVRVDVPAAGMG